MNKDVFTCLLVSLSRPFSSAFSITSLTCSMNDSLSLSRINSLSTCPKKGSKCGFVLRDKDKSTATVYLRGRWHVRHFLQWSTRMRVYHDLGNFLRVVSVQVKPERHHLPVVGLQLTLCNPVSSVGDLHAQKYTATDNKQMFLGTWSLRATSEYGTTVQMLNQDFCGFAGCAITLRT